MIDPLNLTRLPEPGLETRWFSPENPLAELGSGGKVNAGRKGRPMIPFPAGMTAVLAELPAGTSGTLRRIWLTIDDRSPEALRGLRLEAYWDGATIPAISAPLGDFFGHMCATMSAFESAYFGSPEARSFWCTLPMPFRNGMRVTLTNDSGRNIGLFFYDVEVTIGERHEPHTGYLHAVARRQNPTQLQEDYEFLPRTEGRGRFLGVHVGVFADRERYGTSWWGEGEAKFYLDGDAEYPTLSGTGTEDYIATGWGQGRYAERFHGCPLADHDRMAYGFYRWHVADPIYFHQSIRVTMQQIGHCMLENKRWLSERVAATGDPVYAAGPGLVPADLDGDPSAGLLFERQDDWSSVAFFTLDRP